MKYDHLPKTHEQWKTDKVCANFLFELEHVVLKKALKVDNKRPTTRENANYILGKFNLLKNRGYVGVDQQAHTDYPAREAT